MRQALKGSKLICNIKSCHIEPIHRINQTIGLCRQLIGFSGPEELSAFEKSNVATNELLVDEMVIF